MTKLITCLLLALLFCAAAFAQSTETVLYSFGAYQTDGVGPTGGLLFDTQGNIYGTTLGGGTHTCGDDGGCGTVYELSPSPGGYTETILYNFCSTNNPSTCLDGAEPWGGLICDKFGNLYGATFAGGNGNGVAFELSPPASQGGAWTETTLWEFGVRKRDGVGPYQGKLNWDAARGNLYGTTEFGGTDGLGTVFELSPNGSGGWNERVLLSFSGPNGVNPQYGVAIDSAGNLFGTAQDGGITGGACAGGCGTVFELMQSGDRWSSRILYKPNGTKGRNPNSALSIDSEGNLYGTLEFGGTSGCYADEGCGAVFKLAPKSGGGVARYSLLLDSQAGNPMAGVLVDGAKNGLVGTSYWGDNVYQIRNGALAILYQFCSLPNCSDGTDPSPGTPVSRAGVIYGATGEGGMFGVGVIYAVSP